MMTTNEHFANSCLALQSVCSSIQTLLGPNKSLKCYLSSDGDSGILGDTMQVFDALMASYRHHGNSSAPSQGPPPALQLLYERCQEHRTRVGCGTTTLICLSAYWAAEILALAQQDVPIPIVLAMFREVLYKCEDLLSRLSAAYSHATRSALSTSEAEPSQGDRGRHQHVSRKQARVLSFSRHFRPQGSTSGSGRSSQAEGKKRSSEKFIRLIGERLGRGRELAMKLAVEARLKQPQDFTQTSTAIQVPLVYCMVGKTEEHSRVMEGVVTDLHSEMLGVAGHATSNNLRMLVLEGDVSPYWKHLGLQTKAGHVTSHDLSQLYQQSSESKWLAEVTTILQTFDVNVLVVGGTVWPLLWQWCIGAGVVVLKEIAPRIRTVLSDMFRLQPLSYLTQCTQASVGTGVQLEVLEGGWTTLRSGVKRGSITKSHCCRLYKGSECTTVGPVVTTAMLCGVTECGVDRLRHQLQNSSHRLHWATTTSTGVARRGGCGDHTPKPLLFLPGEGKTETAVISMLEREIVKITNLDQEFDTSNLPIYFTSSWMGHPGVVKEGRYRISAYQAFANGLRKYLTRCLMNSRPDLGQFEARSKVEAMILQHRDTKSGIEAFTNQTSRGTKGGTVVDNLEQNEAQLGVDAVTQCSRIAEITNSRIERATKKYTGSEVNAEHCRTESRVGSGTKIDYFERNETRSEVTADSRTGGIINSRIESGTKKDHFGQNETRPEVGVEMQHRRSTNSRTGGDMKIDSLRRNKVGIMVQPTTEGATKFRGVGTKGSETLAKSERELAGSYKTGSNGATNSVNDEGPPKNEWALHNGLKGRVDDVFICKVEAWREAIQLLEFIFLIRKVACPQKKH